MALTHLFIDFNAYFASVEQQLRPDLRDRPVAVIPLLTDSTCCLAASYEAKKYGVKTGLRVGEARRICPDLVLVESRTEEYVRMHHRLLEAIDTCVPVHAVCSIDEMVCRLTGPQTDEAAAVALAHQVKSVIRRRIGESMRCSIGLSTNRFLSKVGTDMMKPDGLVVLRKEDLPGPLLRLKPIDLAGIGPKMSARLEQRGITTIADLYALSEREMQAAWESVLGVAWYRWLRGEDLPESPTTRRSIGHQHVLGPEKRTMELAREVLIRLTHKAAARARSLGYWTGEITVWARFMDKRSWHDRRVFSACRDTPTMVEAVGDLWDSARRGSPLIVGVTLTHLTHDSFATLPLFEGERKLGRISEVMDRVNARHGRSSMYLGSMHAAKNSAPSRIAFSSIPDDLDA